MIKEISLTFHSADFWTYVVFVVGAGFLGGIGNILLSGEFRLWRKVVNKENRSVHYSIGSIKEPFIGGIGGLLVTLFLLQFEKTAAELLYIALLTGFGSSAFLKKYIDGKIDTIQEQSASLMQTENLQQLEEDENHSSDGVVKGVMTTQGPLPVYLTKEEMQRLLTLQSRLGEAISQKEAKVYQFEIKTLINRGKQRAF